LQQRQQQQEEEKDEMSFDPNAETEKMIAQMMQDDLVQQEFGNKPKSS